MGLRVEQFKGGQQTVSRQVAGPASALVDATFVLFPATNHANHDPRESFDPGYNSRLLVSLSLAVSCPAHKSYARKAHTKTQRGVNSVVSSAHLAHSPTRSLFSWYIPDISTVGLAVGTALINQPVEFRVSMQMGTRPGGATR